MDITPIILALLGVAGAGIAALIVWLKVKIPAERFKQISGWVTIFVAAAEKLFKGSGRGAEKLDYVIKALADKGIIVNADSITDAIRAMIEAAVLQLK